MRSPFQLGAFVYRAHRLLPFHWMFLAFGLFILTCGGTSVATALALAPLIPEAVRLMQDARVSEQRREQLVLAHKQQEMIEAEM